MIQLEKMGIDVNTLELTELIGIESFQNCSAQVIVRRGKSVRYSK